MAPAKSKSAKAAKSAKSANKSAAESKPVVGAARALQALKRGSRRLDRPLLGRPKPGRPVASEALRRRPDPQALLDYLRGDKPAGVSLKGGVCLKGA